MERAQLLGLGSGKTEDIGRAGNVAVEDVDADEEVLQLGNDGTGELGKTLGRYDRGDAALAASGAQIGQRCDAETPGLCVARGTGEVRGEQVPFVDGNEHGLLPVLARRPLSESCSSPTTGATVLVLDVTGY